MKASIFDGIVARLSMFTFVSKVYLGISFPKSPVVVILVSSTSNFVPHRGQ